MNDGKSYQVTEQFKYFDLLFLSLLAAVSEWMGSGLLKVWNSSFYFSFATAICLIAMIRWGTAGVLVGMAGGIPAIWFSDMGIFSGILFYVIANVSIGIPILLYGARDRNKICEHSFLLILYVLSAHVCLAIGKGAVIFLLTGEHTGVLDYFGATFLITVLDIIVCLVLNTRKDLLCDMRNYFNKGEGETE